MTKMCYNLYKEKSILRWAFFVSLATLLWDLGARWLSRHPHLVTLLLPLHKEHGDRVMLEENHPSHPCPPLFKIQVPIVADLHLKISYVRS